MDAESTIYGLKKDSFILDSRFKKRQQNMEKEKAEKEFEDVLYILRYVLLGMKIPLSVSYLNAIFASKFKRKFAITEGFMNLFKDEFQFLVIGDDIKIKLKRELNQPIDEKYQGKADEVKKNLMKDLMKVDSIQREMPPSKSMLYKEFCKIFSSKKYRVSYSFINRNSNMFKLKAVDQETFVDIVEDDNIVVPECEFWDIVSSEGLKKLLIRVLLNFFRKFNFDLNQGQLQVCFNYGSLLIDGAFMIENQKYFDKIGSMEYRLKAEFRKSDEDLETSAPVAAIKNRRKAISVERPTIPAKETETHNTIVEVKSTVGKIDTESNTESSSDEECCEFSDSDFESSNSGFVSKGKKKNSDFSDDGEENIQEETQNQCSDYEGSVNDNSWEITNYTAIRNCPWSNRDKLKTKMNNKIKVTDTNASPAVYKTDLKRKISETEQIESAIRNNRSFIFYSEDDLDPLVIGSVGSCHEKREKLEKIGHFVLREICKE